MPQQQILQRLLWFLLPLVLIALFIVPAEAQSRLTEQSRLAIDGIGPIRVGMTIAEAEAAANIRLIEQGMRAGMGQCYHVRPQGGPANLGFMIISDRADNRMVRNQDRIARVEVWRNGRIKTVSGIGNGDTEARVKSTYPGQIQVTPHPYTGRPPSQGKYLTFVPKDAADRNYRMIFETMNGRVVQFRAGRLPEVDYIEGCA